MLGNPSGMVDENILDTYEPQKSPTHPEIVASNRWFGEEYLSFRDHGDVEIPRSRSGIYAFAEALEIRLRGVSTALSRQVFIHPTPS